MLKRRSFLKLTFNLVKGKKRNGILKKSDSSWPHTSLLSRLLFFLRQDFWQGHYWGYKHAPPYNNNQVWCGLPSIPGRNRQKLCEFESNFIFIVSSQPVRTTQGDPVSKKNEEMNDKLLISWMLPLCYLVIFIMKIRITVLLSYIILLK